MNGLSAERENCHLQLNNGTQINEHEKKRPYSHKRINRKICIFMEDKRGKKSKRQYVK